MIQESITLMILGMAIVFAFLILLMFSVKSMGHVLQRCFPEPLPQVATRQSQARLAVGEQDAVVAAITTAIAMHRQQESS
jgi:oxaloacetate decarboxylase (Na+ extruding) subunit gamma